MSSIILRIMLILYPFTGTLQALPCANPLQKIVSDIQPTFTEGLTHLENLFDMVMNYDGNDDDTTKEPIVYAPIQRAIRWTFDSMSDSEQLAQKHLKKYEAKVLALAQDIADKEKRITKEKVALESLKIERSERQRQIESIRREVSHIDGKLGESEDRARRAKNEISRRKRHRIGWSFATIFTLGLASPGLIINERDLQNAEMDHNAHQSNADERQQTFRSVENNLLDISRRQSLTEKWIVGTEASITSVRFVLDKLKCKDPAMRGFGDEIRNITTYLTVCQGKVEVVQQKLLFLFEPLLLSIDELLLFLESNDETTSLLAEKHIVGKMQIHEEELIDKFCLYYLFF